MNPTDPNPITPGITPPGPAGDPTRRLGRFVLLEELGRGGMGVVYRAHDPSLERSIALKTILERPGGSASVDRFVREARLAGRLRHPGIVGVIDVGTDAGRLYIAMDLVEGRSLERIVGPGGLPPEEAARLGAAIADALEHAHVHGVVHRDVKPQNVIVGSDGAPRLTDFGIASDPASAAQGLTETGQALGTPAYAAPEQLFGRRDAIGPRSDVYGLGAVLYFLLTGHPPFEGETVPQVILQVGRGALVPPRERDPAIPEAFAALVVRCLALEPSDRPDSAAEVARELRRFLDGEAPEARPGLGRGLLAVGAVVALVVVAAAVAATRPDPGSGKTTSTDGAPAAISAASTAKSTAETGAATPSATAGAVEPDLPPTSEDEGDLTEPRLIAVLGDERFLLGGHVHHLDVSPDGRRVAVTGASSVRVFELDGTLVDELVDPIVSSPRAIAFEPDGAIRAVMKRALVRWKPGDDGPTVVPQRAPDRGVYAGDELFVAFDHAVARLDPESGAERLRSAPLGTILGLAVSPDLARVAVIIREGRDAFRIEVLDADDLTPERTLPLPSGTFFRFLAFVTDEEGDAVVATGEGFHVVRLDGRVVEVASAPERAGRFAVAPDRRTIALAWPQHGVGVLDVFTGARRAIAPMTGAGAASALAFTPDGSQVVVGHAGGLVQVLDARTGEPTISRSGHADAVTSVAFAGASVVSAGDDGSAFVWDPDRPDAPAAARQGRPGSARIAPGGRWATVLVDVGRIGVVDLRGSPRDDPVLRTRSLHWASPSPTGERIAIASNGGEVVITDVETRESRPLLPREGSNRTHGGWSADGELFACSRTSEMHIIDARTGGVAAVLRPPRHERPEVSWRSIAIGPDLVVAGDNQDNLFTWPRSRLDAPPLWHALLEKNLHADAVAIHPDGRRAAVGTTAGAHIVELDTGVVLWRLPHGAGEVRALAFSEDGARLAVGGSDGTVRVWAIP